MKLGTLVKLKDGRFGTVVYNSLIGVGIKFGIHYPTQEDFEETDGNTIKGNIKPDDWPWYPDALLRDAWPTCEQAGFKKEECVGRDFEIIKQEDVSK